MRSRLFPASPATLVLLIVLPLIAQPMSAATFVVTNAGGSGPGSLAQAIADANASPGVDQIEFAIPVQAPTRFRPLRSSSAIRSPSTATPSLEPRPTAWPKAMTPTSGSRSTAPAPSLRGWA